MTEAEWLVATDVAGMIQHLRKTNVTERKYRLFALECVRQVRDRLEDERSIRALEFAEANAEKRFKGLRGRPHIYSGAMLAAPVPALAPDGSHSSNWTVALRAAHAACALLDDQAWIAALHCSHQTEPPVEDPARAHDAQRHADWFRDIFGNPFRLATFSPEWRTSTAAAIARQIYESRDFSAMPILADALQDAGCDSEEVLGHCRGTGPHVRGCWAVDAVLDKE
jgi:hypothetical protein